jgi:eukaryotic-like serine/threonine-protein kinase
MPKVCPVCDTVYPDANAFCPVDGTTLHVVDLDGGLIGSVIADRYLVTDLLGEGGMGKVYLARHVRLPQQAAIKVLRPEMVRDPAAVARFNREASNASRIDDENVARVYDFGEATGGTVYLAMEYVNGRTLRDMILDEGALDVRRAADLVEQIARGLDAAHRLKIIHRDLKPDNVMVVAGPDGRDKVKVVDFGIAKAFGAGDGGLTKTGFVVGTPEFMSPEQLLGGALDARSDVYALALLAFQCLTASLPFGGDTPEKAMTARLTSVPNPLAVVSGKAWPESVQAAFDAALSRDVDKRPASAGEFARMLKSAIDAWTVSPAMRDASSNVTPQRVTPLVTAAVTPAVTQPITAAIRESAPAPKKNWIPIAAAILVLVGGAGAAWKFSSGRNAQADPAQTETTGVPAPGSQQADSTGKAAGAGGADSSTQTAAAAAAAAGTAAQTAARAPAAEPVATRPKSDSTAATRPVDAKPVDVTDEPAPGSALDSLSALLAGADAGQARAIAGALRNLAPRLKNPASKARAYLRLIDASVSSGDLSAACTALGNARRYARPSQGGEVRRYQTDLGCE